MENSYRIIGLRQPDLEAKIEGLRLEMESLRTIVERLDDEVAGLIKLLEGAEVTAYPLPDRSGSTRQEAPPDE